MLLVQTPDMFLPYEILWCCGGISVMKVVSPRFYINAVQWVSFLCCLYISLQQHRPDSISPSGCLGFHTNANDLLLVQKMYLFSLKLLLLVYFCSCSSAGGRLSHNFFVTSAVNAMMPNYDRLLYVDMLMCRQKYGNAFPSQCAVGCLHARVYCDAYDHCYATIQ